MGSPPHSSPTTRELWPVVLPGPSAAWRRRRSWHGNCAPKGEGMDSPIDFNCLDTVVHGPIRLGVLTALAMDGPLHFTTLKKRLGTADGSLGMHLGKLEDAGYVRGGTALVGRRRRTTY